MSAISAGVSCGSGIPRAFMAAAMAGALFQIVAANSMGLWRTPRSTRSGPTLPPTPPTAWHSTQRFSAKS